MPRLARTPLGHGTFAHEPVRFHQDDLAARRPVGFTCPPGHNLTVAFADGAKLPASWECRQHSVEAGRRGALHQPTPLAQRTHWDMPRKGRPEPELARLLDKQPSTLRAGQLMPVSRWLHQVQRHRTSVATDGGAASMDAGR